jgi:hypothetical protein
MIVLDIAAFQSIDLFNQRMDELIAELKSVPLAAGVRGSFLSGRARSAQGPSVPP